MFHFPAFPPHRLYIQQWVTAHNDCRVSPFGNPRITARLTTPRGLSRPPTSFIGSWCQGIHRAPLKTWPQMLASTVQFSNNDQPPITPNQRSENTGAGTEGTSFPQTPNSVPDQNPSEDHAFHTPKGAVLTASDPDPGRLVNVPPMSNQHQTLADVLAPDLTPKGSVRSAP